jgi:hypothetical protein
MFRMRSYPPIQTKKGFPSRHDFTICFNLSTALLALLDQAMKQVDSTIVKETLFHIRGFVVEEMAEVNEFVRPKE